MNYQQKSSLLAKVKITLKIDKTFFNQTKVDITS